MSQTRGRARNVSFFLAACALLVCVLFFTRGAWQAADPSVFVPAAGTGSERNASAPFPRRIDEPNRLGSDPVATELPDVGGHDRSSASIVATRLPLELLGTLVGDPESLSEAVILHTEVNKHAVVRLGEPLEFFPDVTVVAIQQGRVLLRSASGIEKLVLSPTAGGDFVAQASASSEIDSTLEERTEEGRKPLATTARLATIRGPGIRMEVVEAMERMAANFANDLEPSLDSAGKIDGLRAIQITDGGLLDEVGLTREDVIQGVNGVKITSAEGAKRVLRDLASCQPMTGLIVGRTGEREVEFTAEILEKFDCAR